MVITKATVRTAIAVNGKRDAESICRFLLGENNWRKRHLNRAERCVDAVDRQDLSCMDYMRAQAGATS